MLYVALTRATEFLTCSWVKTRTFGDQRTIRARSPAARRSRRRMRRRSSWRWRPAGRPPRLRPVPAPPEDASAMAAEAEQRLRDWRTGQARAVRVLPAAVLPDDVLVAVAACAADQRGRTGQHPRRRRAAGPTAGRRHARRPTRLIPPTRLDRWRADWFQGSGPCFRERRKSRARRSWTPWRGRPQSLNRSIALAARRARASAWENGRRSRISSSKRTGAAPNFSLNAASEAFSPESPRW